MIEIIKRKRPFGRFLLIQWTNNLPQTQPRHPSLDVADPASQYGGTQHRPCSALYELTLVQRDFVRSPAHCTSLESWNESHEPLPFCQEYSSPLGPFSETWSPLCLRVVLGLWEKGIPTHPVNYIIIFLFID